MGRAPLTAALRTALLVAAAALGGAAACAGGAGPGRGPGASETTGAWASRLDVDHPLVGRIYDAALRREVSEAELLDALARARFVVLGEQHENADHHALQARVVRGLGARGRAPALAFEMLSRDLQPALDAALAGPSPAPEDVRVATRWDESGWPAFALYAPVFEAALAAALPLVAADLSKADRDRLAAEGPLPAALEDRLGLGEPLPAEIATALERELLDAHCGALPASALPRLVRVQRGRDAELARALAEAAGALGAGARAPGPEGGAVLVTGAGHARRDRGAPRALARLAPGATVAALAFVEVSPSRRDPLAGVAGGGGSAPVFDYVWYTPRASDEDYCERMTKPAPR